MAGPLLRSLELLSQRFSTLAPLRAAAEEQLALVDAVYPAAAAAQVLRRPKAAACSGVGA